MSIEALKLELIEWLSSLNNSQTIEYIKKIKDSDSSDWWNELNTEQRKGIEKGLRDIEENRIVSHEEVKKKYGL